VRQFGAFAIPAGGLDARFREHEGLDEFKLVWRSSFPRKRESSKSAKQLSGSSEEFKLTHDRRVGSVAVSRWLRL